MPNQRKTNMKWGIACTGAFLVLLMFASCDHNSSLGNYLVETRTRTIKIDTFTVRLSVLAKDSIITSSRGVIFVGEYDDPLIGKSTASSYVEFAKTSDTESNEYPRFDSVVFVMRLTGNYYGDTLVYPEMKISRLAQPIEMDDDGVRYSSYSIPLREELPILHRFRMKGPSQKEIEMRLPDEFGEELFDGIIKKRDEMNADNYLKTFSGLAIEPAPGNSCIYAYSTADSACQIRIHYRISEEGELKEKTMTFKANDIKQFNHLETQMATGSKLPTSSKSDPVSTNNTHNMGFVMTGCTPLFTRLDFPDIERLQDLGEIVVIERARLFIRPVRHSYDVVPLPAELNLFPINSTNNLRGANQPLTALSAGSTQAVTMSGNLNATGKNIKIHELYYYDYDITNYIASQITAVGYDRYSLCIDFPTESNARVIDRKIYPFQRLVFGDQNYFYQSEPISDESRVRLEITYSIYNEY